MKFSRNEMRLLIHMSPLLLLLIFAASINCNDNLTVKEEDYDDDAGVIPFTHFCKFDLPMMNHSTTNDEDFCDCDVISSPVIGRPTVKINCEMSNHVTNLTNKLFQGQNLPVNTVTLILSYQHFHKVPVFIGAHLKHLDMSNNLITIIKDDNFIHVTSLEHLDVSYNSISTIESSAFQQLQLLHYLDLSSNRIVKLPLNIFAPLKTLETLKLSGNVGIDGSIFKSFGVVPILNNLVMTHCELTTLNLHQGIGLKRINLSFNNVTNLSNIILPDNVESLELSGNPISRITKASLPSLSKLEELIFEDLSQLGVVNEFSLREFPKLRHMTFEGSKKLSIFKFDNSTYEDFDVQLKIFNLRGCNLNSLDIELLPIVGNLEEFHLDGNPFNCDCNVKWLKNLEKDTKLQCHRPELLAGRFLMDVPDKKLNCENFFMTKLINTLILLFLLVACSLAIWFFLRRLNPSRKNKFQKVGPESPYQRVTIEPNRAEYSLY